MSDSKAETSRGRSKDNPLDAVIVDVTQVAIPPRPKAARYWCGMFHDAPLDNYTVGGVQFQKWTGPIEFDPRTHAILDRNSARIGNVVELTADQVDLIKSRVATRVARVVGNPASRDGSYRVLTWDKTAPGYNPQHGDQHVADWLYMVPVTETMPAFWNQKTPTVAMSGKRREVPSPAVA